MQQAARADSLNGCQIAYIDNVRPARQHQRARPLRVTDPMIMSSTSHTDTVLVTDDNRDVVDALVAFLNLSGYKVIATYSAREALDSLDQDSTVGVVISDVRMPELDGFDFLRVVKHRFPAIKVILVTGHEITDDDVVPSGATILKKPLEFEQLLRLLPSRD